MKRKITIVTTIICCLLFSSTAEAQTSWLITGNSGTTSGTNFVGTTDSKVLSFRTKNIEYMRIDTTGYVGIGDLSPSYPLEVSGGVSAGSLSSGGNFMVTINANNTAAMGAQSSPKNAVFGAMDSLINILFVTRVSNTFQERMRITNAGLVGIGTSSPAYNLDVQASNGSVNIKNTLTTGYSGLYFSNTGGNAIGQVWMNATTQGDYGGSNSLNLYTGTNSPIAFFTNSATAPHMFISGGGSVGIGIALGTPGAKLDVATTTTGSIAVKGANSASSGTNYGGYFEAVGAGTSNIGLLAGVTSTATSNYGIYIASLTASANNYSFYNPASAKSYFGGSVGIGTTSPGYILTVNGQPGCNGFTQFFNYSDSTLKTNISNIDSSLAKIMKLRPVQFNYNQDYLNLWNDTIMPNNAAELQTVHRGFIAQEVKQIFPEMVGVDSIKGHAYCDLNLSNLQVYLVKAMQEQQKMIDSLKQNQKTSDSLLNHQKAIDSMQTIALNNMALHQQATESLLNQQRIADSLLTETVNNLMATVTNCCSQNSNPKMMLNNSGQTQGETLQVELANNNQIILFQNQPNPFNESTVIRYFVPENITGSAFVIFYDVYGQEIKRTEITTKGFGNINVNAENLLSGVYSYSLLIDGKLIDTKKMIKNK